ncbi:MAG: hypothetical protein ACE37F_32100 [Nannocystaceae bacterium]|nr:hypothetical protein [bacterium]
MDRWTVAFVALLFGCGPEGGGELFGAGTLGSGAPGTATSTGGGSSGGFMTTSISASDADGDGDGDNSSSPDPSAGSSGDETASPTTGVEPTTGTTTSGDDGGSTSTGSEASSSSSSSSSGAGDDMGDDGGMMGGMQPDDGMYSPCTVPRDCGFAPELCITLSDMDGMVLDGFCSETTCVNPAVDCDPSPGGTAPTACLDVNVDGMADTACVLDCTGGATCPTGMTCYSLGAMSICG